MDAKFELGRVVATPGALALIEKAGVPGTDLIDRHVAGDWGDVLDPGENEAALANGERLLSVYETGAGTLWIITEWDRSVTTLLLPSEY